ncbi:MAG: histidinol phosphatase [Flavobacteriales bacterium]|jgi:protein-tyrosine phosphatase|nr:histidinol phosphatase [Flavobacteriales bacterium]
MNFFFRKKRNKVDVSAIKTDVHSHLLPGIDDGAQKVEESMDMIRALVSLGFENFVYTPHIMGDYYPNNAETIGNALKEVDYKLKIESMHGHKHHAAAEYFFDERLLEYLENKELRTFPNTQNFLFELSFRFRPKGVKDFVYQAQMKGYKPVLAHPERYEYMTLDQYEDLKNRGVQFQLDLMSLTNHYSKPAKKNAELLISKGMIDWVGTDIHRMKHIDVLEEALCTKACHELVNSGRLLNPTLFK